MNNTFAAEKPGEVRSNEYLQAHYKKTTAFNISTVVWIDFLSGVKIQ